jgi:ATP-dependent Lhr-like helicase
MRADAQVDVAVVGAGPAGMAAAVAARAAGASVVLVDGLAALYLDRGGSSLQTLPPFDEPRIAAAALSALPGLIADGRARELVVSRVDGEPVARSPWYETLLKAGFVQGYRGLVMRKPRAGAMIA